jgi:excisionase family DNA binding protein
MRGVTGNASFGQEHCLLSLAEAADVLAISIRGVRRLLAAGALSSVHVGARRRLIDPSDLARYIDAHRERLES